MSDEQNKIIAYKGFDKDLKCRGFQYRIGEHYTHEGPVEPCLSGFHSCTNPWDVLGYYDITSRFAVVELGGETKTHKNDLKIASAEITIKAELKLPEFISKLVNFVIDACKDKNESGNLARIGSSGNLARIGSSGDSAQIGSSGDSAQIGSSGDYAQIGSSGDYARIGSSGNLARIGSSGDSAQIGSSGDYAQIGSSGDSAQIGSSGNYARIGSSGDYAQIIAEGKSSIITSSGINSKGKVGELGTLVLSRWIEEEKRYRVSVGYEGENIRRDVLYKLNDSGEFVECDE
jgi:hypothetical protein